MNKTVKNRILSAALRAALAVIVVIAGLRLRGAGLPSGGADGFMRAVFFDAGQGDCALICSGEGAILVDAADGISASVTGYMQRLGIKRLDYFIVTHFDRDHAGDVTEILDRFEVGAVVMPEPAEDGYVYNFIKERIKDGKTVTAMTGLVLYCGDMEIEIMAPNRRGRTDNETSVVCRISRGPRSVLMCADVTASEEKTVMAKYGVKCRSDVLKVSHHGSDSSSSDEFLKLVLPSFAVISCGRNNYGHPSVRVIGTLQSIGCDVAITEGDGVVIYDLFDDHVERKK